MSSSQEIIIEDIIRVASKVDLTPFKNATVLLAGANGLIGSYFAHLFYYLNEKLSYNTKVDLISRHDISSESRIYGIRNSSNFTILEKDISQYTSYSKPYDFMIHAAGYGAPSVFLAEPLKTMEVNYMGLKSMLESAVSLNPHSKILYLSSSEVYGSPPTEFIPTPETYVGNSSISNNRACYIESKRLCEVMALSYIKIYNMYIKVARPALSYGPGMSVNDQRVLSQFIKKGYSGVINMIDDGKDIRSYCYMSDVLRQLLSILLYGKDNTYNVGSSEESISVKELAQKIGKIMNAKAIAGPGKDSNVTGAPNVVCLDMTKLSTEFGFKPEVLMDEGLERIIAWNTVFNKEQNIKL
jgi:UDP-glucuronate decarboxylase